MTMMKKDMLEDAKLTEEEMESAAGGARRRKANFYTVKEGDCLIKIAKKLGIRNWHSLVEWNVQKYPNLAKNPNYIRTGWKLTYFE